MQQSNSPPEPVLPRVAIPTVRPHDVDRVLAIGQATAAAAEALHKASSAAHALGLPDPDTIGIVGLDHSAVSEVSVSLMVWAGALLEGAHVAATKLTVVGQDLVRP